MRETAGLRADRFNSHGLYNKVLGMTSDCFAPVIEIIIIAKHMEKNLPTTKSYYSEHILSVPWPFLTGVFTVTPS